LRLRSESLWRIRGIGIRIRKSLIGMNTLLNIAISSRLTSSSFWIEVSVNEGGVSCALEDLNLGWGFEEPKFAFRCCLSGSSGPGVLASRCPFGVLDTEFGISLWQIELPSFKFNYRFELVEDGGVQTTECLRGGTFVTRGREL